MPPQDRSLFGNTIPRAGTSIAAEVQEELDANSTRQLTQLCQSTLQLNDQELLQLFQESLHGRPWLRSQVSQVLGMR